MNAIADTSAAHPLGRVFGLSNEEYHAGPGVSKSQLDTDAATLLAEVDPERAAQLNQAIYLLMASGDKVPLTQIIQQLMDAALKAMAKQAWNDHVAQLHDAMSDEQFEQYQHRSAA